MKNKTLHFILLVVLMVVAIPLAQAQETPPTHRTLSGEIRWKKSLGLPANFDGSKPLEITCQPFYVLVLDPAQDDKPYWFANVLVRGRDGEDFYRCKYEIINVPTNKRLKVVVGMGDPFTKPFGNTKPHWYRDKWWVEGRKPEEVNQQVQLAIPYGFQVGRLFDPNEKFVTLTKKNMWLSFELIGGLVSTRTF